MTDRCPHKEFSAGVAVARLEDVGRFVAEVQIHCVQCKRRFQFLGLQAGVDTGGATVSIDGLQAQLAICPEGEQPSALDRIAAHFPTDRRH